ncbi:hypothetical protein NX059_004063 [Plenodomus lindquistii]|nr:hypothetical protein NX059_004063 [Plenodomus lindquistii]
MRGLSYLLFGASVVSAFSVPKASEDCEESSTSQIHTSPYASYATASPIVHGYNGTYGTNDTSTTTTTTTKTVVVEPYKTDEPTNTFTAFPTDVFTSIPTLRPVMPASHDADSLDCLNAKSPGPGTPLHYAEESKPGSYEAGVFAVVIPRFNIPSVVLDYANAANTVKIARGGDLIIGFSDLQAFLRSVSSWDDLDEIVFVTYTEGCGDYADGERCYFLASKLYFDQASLTVRAVGKPRDVRDLAEDINVSWGSYKDEQFNGATPVATSADGVAVPTATGTDAPSNFPTLIPATNGTSINGTNTTSVDFGGNNNGCRAPVDTKYGLPTSCVGPHFDDNLDDGLGYKTAQEFSWAEWVEIVSLADPYAEAEFFETTNTTSLRKRNIMTDKLRDAGRKLGKFAKDKKDAIVKDAKALGNKIESTTKAVVKGTVAVVNVAKNIITGKPNIYENEFTKLILPPKKDNPECQKDQKKCELNSKDAKSVKSPWDEDGILLKSFGQAPSESELLNGRKTRKSVKGQFLNIYCVKCGLHGSAKVVGNLTIKGTEVHEGKISVDMNLEVGLGIGVYAQFLRKEVFDANLYNVPVSPFTIGVLTIGPYISIGARATFMVNATGSALARADLKFAKAKFVYDFKDNSKSKQIGFNPQFVPKFEAEGEIQLEATFGVPVALKVGLSTLKGCKRCEAAIGIEDYPHIKASAQLAVNGSWGDKNLTTLLDEKEESTLEGGVKTITGCKGIMANLTIGNTLSMVFNGFGFVKQEIELWKMPEFGLHSWCLGQKQNGTEKKKESKRFIDASAHEYNLRNYPRDGTNDTTELVDLTQYVVSDNPEPSWDGVDIPSTSYGLGEDFDGFWYTTVVYGHAGDETASDETYNLVSCSDGNIYLQENKTANELDEYMTCTSLWGGYDDAILSDPNGGFLYYYGNTMSKTNVSRVRSAYALEVPDTAEMVVLAPFYYDDTNAEASVLAAFDDHDQMFFPVVCTYSDASSAKIYLVSDLERGIETLKSPDLKYTVTNGDVAECSFLPLTWGADTNATEPEWASYDETDYLSDVDAFSEEIEFDQAAFSNGDWIDEIDDESDEWFEEFSELMFDDEEYTQ